MTLWTKELEKKTPELYSTEDVELSDKKVTAKFFALGSGYTWYVVEAQKQDDGDVLFFGYVDSGQGGEWGYFVLSELESLRYLGGIPRVERDLHFHPKKFKEIA